MVSKRSFLCIIAALLMLIVPSTAISAQERPIITADNVNRLQVLASLIDADYNGIPQISWSADSARLAVGRGDGPFVYAAPTFSNVINLGGGASTLAFSPVGPVLAVSVHGLANVSVGGVYLHNLATGAVDYLDHKNVISLAFSPDGKLLASGSGEGQVNLWDLGTLARVATFSTNTTLGAAHLAFSPDGRILSVVNPGSWGIQFWGVDALLRGAAQTPVRVIQVPSVIRGETSNLVFDRTGNNIFFAAPETDETMVPQQWSLTLAQPSSTEAPLSLDVRQERAKSQQLHDYGSIRRIALNPAGDILALASADGQVYLVDAITRAQLAALPGSPGAAQPLAPLHVAFSPDGTMLAVAGEKGPVYVWGVQ